MKIFEEIQIRCCDEAADVERELDFLEIDELNDHLKDIDLSEDELYEEEFQDNERSAMSSNTRLSNYSFNIHSYQYEFQRATSQPGRIVDDKFARRWNKWKKNKNYWREFRDGAIEKKITETRVNISVPKKPKKEETLISVADFVSSHRVIETGLQAVDNEIERQVKLRQEQREQECDWFKKAVYSFINTWRFNCRWEVNQVTNICMWGHFGKLYIYLYHDHQGVCYIPIEDLFPDNKKSSNKTIELNILSLLDQFCESHFMQDQIAYLIIKQPIFWHDVVAEMYKKEGAELRLITKMSISDFFKIES